MNRAALVLVAMLLCALPSRAEDTPAIMIGGETPAPTHRSCVEVEIGGDKAFGCLNRKLKEQVERVNPPTIDAPIDARSPDIRVGVVNIPAIKQQYGRNFGVSAAPYREPLIYRSPFGLRR